MAVSISVVVNAYAHEQYVDEAIDSVLRQQGAHDFEVIVLNAIEGYEPSQDVRRKASRRDIPLRSLAVARRPVGRGLVDGYEASKKDVIALLDDDDRWKPGKLAAVEEAFENDGVIYFHNGQEIVNEFGRPVPFTNLHRWVRHPSSLLPEGRRVLIDSNDLKALAAIRRLEPEFNNSSICVRRELISENLEILQNVTRGEDGALFSCALSSGRALFATTDRLTQYRLHKGSVTSSPPALHPAEGSLGRYARDAELRRNQFEQLESTLARKLNPAGAASISTEIAFWRILQGVAAGRPDPSSLHSDVNRLLGGSYARPRPRELLAALLGATATVVPTFARGLLGLWRIER